MDHALLVRRLERVRDLAPDRDQLGLGQWTVEEALGQRLTGDQLHDEELVVAVRGEVVDRANMRMIEA
jgi:hypothetical protein